MKEEEIVKLRFGDWSEGSYYSITVSSDNPNFCAGHLVQTINELSNKYNSYEDFFIGHRLDPQKKPLFVRITDVDLDRDLSAEDIAQLFIHLINQENPDLKLKRTKDVRRCVLETEFGVTALAR